MGLVFKVGEHHDFPPVPNNFPKCGSWLPPIDEQDNDETTPVSRSPEDRDVSSAKPAIVAETTTENGVVVENYEENFIPYRLTNGSLSHAEGSSITSISGSPGLNEAHVTHLLASAAFALLASLLLR